MMTIVIMRVDGRVFVRTLTVRQMKYFLAGVTEVHSTTLKPGTYLLFNGEPCIPASRATTNWLQPSITV